MPTAIDMASNALLLIGDEPISSFTEPGAGATAAANLYEETYKGVLAEHPWSFAFKEQELSRLSQTPDPETFYTYAFQVPVDLIRLWSIMPLSNYVIVGEFLYSNQPDLLARYVFQADETALPAHVVKAVEYKLASEFSVSVTEDRDKAQYYEQKYMMQLAKAMAIDSQGRPQEPIKRSPFTDVRGAGRWI